MEKLANQAAHLKYPEIPRECLARRKYSDNNANGLTKCIIDFIRLHNGQAERINNMGRRISNKRTFTDVLGNQRIIGNSKWIKGSGTNGTADISATINGLSIKIEVKHGKDRQSEAQKQYQKTIEQSGGIYVIARDFEQFMDWYNATFAYND